MEHSHCEKGILDSARTRFLADFVVAGVQADPHFRTSYYPVAVGSAAAADSYLVHNTAVAEA